MGTLRLLTALLLFSAESLGDAKAKHVNANASVSIKASGASAGPHFCLYSPLIACTCWDSTAMPFLGSCQQLLVLFMNNLQMPQNTGCFVWILCFSSQSLRHRTSSPLPLLSMLLLSGPGARWSCRSELLSGGTCWGAMCLCRQWPVLREPFPP